MTAVLAMCAEHPDREAKGGVCARCGSFVCEECAKTASTGIVYCTRCAARVGIGGKLHHLPWLGGFLIAHGVLILLASVLCVGYTIFFGMMSEDETVAMQTGGGLELAAGMYGFFAVLHLIPGVLQILAGRRVLKRRDRVFAFVALGSGLLTVMPGCCALTAIALLIYGLIVLLDHAVTGAFDRPAEVS
jgi:hypothetical protein